MPFTILCHLTKRSGSETISRKWFCSCKWEKYELISHKVELDFWLKVVSGFSAAHLEKSADFVVICALMPIFWRVNMVDQANRKIVIPTESWRQNRLNRNPFNQIQIKGGICTLQKCICQFLSIRPSRKHLPGQWYPVLTGRTPVMLLAHPFITATNGKTTDILFESRMTSPAWLRNAC